ncbi:branched-chain amino acid ABC transporter permease [Catellatospora sp. NPDC049133]|uniref:branched-chain amino acid ABC transporter permease n=1 Tax=Catellatospora sp. NPDC049133 TaxID=3155499 RepID=UPI0033D1B548
MTSSSRARFLGIPAPALTAAGVAASMSLPWLADAYTVSLASYGLVAALVAVSAHLLTTTVAMPTLGQAAYFGVGAYTAAVLGQGVSSGLVQLIAAATAGAGAAAVIGSALVRTRGMVFLVLTIAVGEVARVAAEQAVPLTGGGNGLAAVPVSLPGGAELVHDGHVYLYILTCTLAITGGLHVLLRSRTGITWRAIADHEARMQANGFSVHTRLWTAYVTAGALAGAAGALLIAARRFVSPTDVAFSTSALALLAAIIGARSVTATVFAALLIVGVRDVAGAALPGTSPLLLGLVFVAAALARGGRGRRLAARVLRRPDYPPRSHPEGRQL